jgi:hypothetical protein
MRIVFTLSRGIYILYPVPYNRCPIPYTLYPSPLYPMPYTLYPIPYTLYPSPLCHMPYALYPIPHHA